MGLLKHAVLPVFILLDLFFVYKCFIAQDISDVQESWGRDTSKSPITDIEVHFQHILGSIFACFLLNNLTAIFIENAHYRGIAVAQHTIFFIMDACSYVWMGVEIPKPMFVVVGIGLVGLLVHSREPGIFTKDKNSAKNKAS